MNVLFPKCYEAIDYAVQNKSFGCFCSEKHDANTDIHLHECCEILFCISGGKSFFIDERIYDVTPGSIFVMNKFESHKITSDPRKTFKRYVLQIHPSYIYDNSTPESDLSCCFDLRGESISNRLDLTDEESAKILHLFKKLEENHKFGDDILKNSAVLEILATVNQYFMEKNKHYTYKPSLKNQTLITALDYINQNFSSPITLETVAENCFVSVSTLSELFKRCMGTGPAKYITSKRMTEAKRLLQNGESVASAAEKCGYMDYTSFIRAFKRATGVSPGHYRT